VPSKAESIASAQTAVRSSELLKIYIERSSRVAVGVLVITYVKVAVESSSYRIIKLVTIFSAVRFGSRRTELRIALAKFDRTPHVRLRRTVGSRVGTVGTNGRYVRSHTQWVLSYTL
jgi:hypothetical protein